MVSFKKEQPKLDELSDMLGVWRNADLELKRGLIEDLKGGVHMEVSGGVDKREGIEDDGEEKEIGEEVDDEEWGGEVDGEEWESGDGEEEEEGDEYVGDEMDKDGNDEMDENYEDDNERDWEDGYEYEEMESDSGEDEEEEGDDSEEQGKGGLNRQFPLSTNIRPTGNNSPFSDSNTDDNRSDLSDFEEIEIPSPTLLPVHEVVLDEDSGDDSHNSSDWKRSEGFNTNPDSDSKMADADNPSRASLYMQSNRGSRNVTIIRNTLFRRQEAAKSLAWLKAAQPYISDWKSFSESVEAEMALLCPLLKVGHVASKVQAAGTCAKEVIKSLGIEERERALGDLEDVLKDVFQILTRSVGASGWDDVLKNALDLVWDPEAQKKVSENEGPEIDPLQNKGRPIPIVRRPWTRIEDFILGVAYALLSDSAEIHKCLPHHTIQSIDDQLGRLLHSRNDGSLVSSLPLSADQLIFEKVQFVIAEWRSIGRTKNIALDSRLRSLQKVVGAITEDWDDSCEEGGIRDDFEDDREGDGAPVSKMVEMEKVESGNSKKRKRGSVDSQVKENPRGTNIKEEEREELGGGLKAQIDFGKAESMDEILEAFAAK